MTLGFCMLVHDSLDRAAQVARHWAGHGCPVVIHVDRRTATADWRRFRAALADLDNVLFCRRHRCEWGTFSLVAASQAAAALMLASFPQVRHVYLASGSCLPLRPVPELVRYLDERPDTDFIESVTTEDVPWTVGGLDSERFTLRFPFSWRRHRRLFDGYVGLQRRLRMRRRLPPGLVPHMGSQWWCLTRRTLSLILDGPERAAHDRYFRRVWIPDESYYQTLVRFHGTKVESRSLTLSKFDFQGKPHVFYDDHLQLLRRSDCFVARKIWPHADRLYQAFLTDGGRIMRGAEPNPGKIDRVFSKALDLRTRGRPGLYMQSRFPRNGWENGRTAAPYTVLEGFSELFDGFEGWLARATGVRVHGHLFAPEGAEFAGRQAIHSGALSASAGLRDYNPRAFLTSLIWNTRGEHQCFQFGPADTQAISRFVADNPDALVAAVTGAWAVPLWRSGRPIDDLRPEMARLQRIETEHLGILRSARARARIRIWTLAEFVDAPMEPLRAVLDSMPLRQKPRLAEAPRLVNLDGFGQFLQELRNRGMQPHLMGDFPAHPLPAAVSEPRPRRYVES